MAFEQLVADYRTVRIGTWNVEYAADAAKNERRRRRLQEADCDIWILTETHDDLTPGPEYVAAHTAQRLTGRAGARWTTIWSRYPIEQTLPVEDEHRTVAALLSCPQGPLIVFGTVLPWHSDAGPRSIAPSWAEFYRVTPQQGAEWLAMRRAHPDAALCVAGDFNMNLGGKHHYGTVKGRQMLRDSLAGAGLDCVTEWTRLPEAALRSSPIDHIALSAELASRAQLSSAWEGTDADGIRLSDHSGLAVSIAAPT